MQLQTAAAAIANKATFDSKVVKDGSVRRDHMSSDVTDGGKDHMTGAAEQLVKDNDYVLFDLFCLYHIKYGIW